MNDYFKDFQLIKVILAIVCVISATLSICIIKSSFDDAEIIRNEIFIADAQNTLILARSSDMKSNRCNEAKAVTNKMHVHLFYMTPTASAIQNGIDNACLLGDESVVQYCNQLMETGWYNKMMAEGISTEFICDSINTYGSDKPEYDFLVKLYGKTSTIYPHAIEFRRIVTSQFVKQQERTIKNPNGYRCCLFKIEQNEVIRTFLRENNSNDSIN